MKHTKFGRRLAMLAAVGLLSAAGAVTVWASVRLDTVSDPYWDDDNMTFAVWDEVEDAYQYEVYLYCNESRVADIKTKKTRFDMEAKMTREGDYTFRVRALAKKGNGDFRDSYWSDYSDSIYIDQSFADVMKNGGRIDTANSGPGAAGGTGTSAVVPNSSVVYQAQWIQNEKGWWYQREDGTYPVNGWFQDPATAKWYFMNAEGYMMTGWIDVNGRRYYCGPSGDMYVGDTTIDGVSYHFDASGALIAG